MGSSLTNDVPVPTATSERFVWFFDTMWRLFVRGYQIDNVDLMEVLEASGLATWTKADAAMAERSAAGVVEGDSLLVLTPKAINAIREMNPPDTPRPHR